MTDLETAVLKAPASCLLLHKLGDRLSLEGKYFRATGLYARAVTVDPTFDSAVYRLGANLAALSRQGSGWTGATYSERASLIDSLRRAAGTLGVGFVPSGAFEGPDPNATLKQLSANILDCLSTALRAESVLARYSRRDQRDGVGPVPRILLPFGPRRRNLYMVRAAKLTVAAMPEDEQEIVDFAENPRSGWHVCYNLACYFAINNEPGVAISWLERAVTRPGVEQLSREWLDKDPDLSSLRGLARYKLLPLPGPTSAEES
jgi:hypothetical protein